VKSALVASHAQSPGPTSQDDQVPAIPKPVLALAGTPELAGGTGVPLLGTAGVLVAEVGALDALTVRIWKVPNRDQPFSQICKRLNREASTEVRTEWTCTYIEVDLMSRRSRSRACLISRGRLVRELEGRPGATVRQDDPQPRPKAECNSDAM
jgi:hypothetical protein